MTKEHKEFIEDLILKFKSADNGIITSSQFVAYFYNDHQKRIAITKYLKDLNFIDNVGTGSYRLTVEGWKFKSFDDLDQIEKNKTDKELIEIEVAKSNLDANELNKEVARRNEKIEKNNRITTWVNIIIGALNLGLILWQILKEN